MQPELGLRAMPRRSPQEGGEKLQDSCQKSQRQTYDAVSQCKSVVVDAFTLFLLSCCQRCPRTTEKLTDGAELAQTWLEARSNLQRCACLRYLLSM